MPANATGPRSGGRDLLAPEKIAKISAQHPGTESHDRDGRRGYVYFQDFIPDNQFDTRVTVIGNRAFAFIRKVRPGDFRCVRKWKYRL